MVYTNVFYFNWITSLNWPWSNPNTELRRWKWWSLCHHRRWCWCGCSPRWRLSLGSARWAGSRVPGRTCHLRSPHYIRKCLKMSVIDGATLQLVAYRCCNRRNSSSPTKLRPGLPDWSSGIRLLKLWGFGLYVKCWMACGCRPTPSRLRYPSGSSDFLNLCLDSTNTPVLLNRCILCQS